MKTDLFSDGNEVFRKEPTFFHIVSTVLNFLREFRYAFIILKGRIVYLASVY